MTYRPLPPELTISKSSIEGLGLFAKVDIDKDHVLGISHVKNSKFENNYIRTPLGGFINHSDQPNCKYLEKGDFLVLKTIKEIKEGTELTTKYFLYSLNGEEFK